MFFEKIIQNITGTVANGELIVTDSLEWSARMAPINNIRVGQVSPSWVDLLFMICIRNMYD